MVLYVATSNAGKLRDFAHAAKIYADGGPGDAVRIEVLPGLKEIPPPPEDDPTFEGNARAKAIYYAERAPGLHVLADDSGLEVSGLNGAPGVRSARYADDVGFPHAAAASLDERNNAALLRALDGVPEICRQAKYRCVLALACATKPDTKAEVLATAEGSLDGVILTAPQGEAGFGYDPLFLLPELKRTMAEVDMGTRLEMSHRGRALRALLAQMDRR